MRWAAGCCCAATGESGSAAPPPPRVLADFAQAQRLRQLEYKFFEVLKGRMGDPAVATQCPPHIRVAICLGHRSIGGSVGPDATRLYYGA